MIKASETKETNDSEEPSEDPSRATEDEDTVDEAPSIVDEAMSKESSKDSVTQSSKNWNTAENVVPMVQGDMKLKDALKEGEEVKDVLTEGLQDVPEEIPEEEEEKPPSPPPPVVKKPAPMSHFKAMALLGKMFLGGGLRSQIKKDMDEQSSTTTGSTESTSETGSEEESDEEEEEEEEENDEGEPQKEDQEGEEGTKHQDPSPPKSEEKDDFWDTNSDKAKKEDEPAENETKECSEKEKSEESQKSIIENPVEASASPTEEVEQPADDANVEKIKIEAEVHVGADSSLQVSEVSANDGEAMDDGKKEEDENCPTLTLTTAEGETGNLNEEAAAIKIQSGFRGHQARQRVRALKEEDEPSIATSEDTEAYDCSGSSSEEDGGVTQISNPNETTPHEANKTETVEEEIDIDLEDPDVADAATKIQAGFRGSQARKQVQAMKDEKETDSAPAEGNEQPKEENEEIDIDLEDPEVADAAVKIQAGFRGHQTRKQMKTAKEGEEPAAADEGNESNEKPAVGECSSTSPQLNEHFNQPNIYSLGYVRSFSHCGTLCTIGSGKQTIPQM